MNNQPTEPGQRVRPALTARPLASARALRAPTELELMYLPRRDAVAALLLVMLVTIVAPFLLLLAFAAGSTPEDDQQQADPALVMPLTIVQKWCELALAVAAAVCLVRGFGFRPASLGLRRDGIRRQMLWGIATLGGLYLALLASSIILVMIMMLAPGTEEDLTRRLEFLELLPIRDLLTTLLLLVPVAIHEELIFRGLLLPCLRRWLGNWWAAGLVSAALFAALHAPHQGFLAAGIQILSLAAAFTVFFIVSRSLIAVTLAHFLFDFFQFQFLRLLAEFLENAAP